MTVAYSPNPASNPPTLNADVQFDIWPAVVNGCRIWATIGLTGANSGQTVYDYISQATGHLVYYYTGVKPGIDHFSMVFHTCGTYSFDPSEYDATVYWGKANDGRCTAGKARLVSKTAARLYQCVDDPVDGGAGLYETSVTDARLPSVGVPFAFMRTYNSDGETSKDLGYGWHDPYSAYIDLSQKPSAVTIHMGSGQQLLFSQTNGVWTGPAWTTATLTLANNVYTLTLDDRTRYTFEGSYGSLTGIYDRNGQGLIVSASPGQPSWVETSDGKKITFRYNNGKIAQMTLPDGRSVSYGYDSNGNLTSVTDLRGGVTQYSYDSYHELLTVKDPRGNIVLTNTYNNGQLTSQADALGNTTSYSYDSSYAGCDAAGGSGTVCSDEMVVTATDPRGNAWKTDYSGTGTAPDSETDPLGNTSSYSYDPTTGNPLSYTDPLDNTVSYQYDTDQNLTQTTLPGGIVTSATYNGTDLASSTDGRGYTTSYSYDGSGNPTEVSLPDGHAVGLAYNSLGELTGITDQAGKTTGYAYNSLGEPTSVTTPLGNVTTYGYDASGRRTSIVDPRGNASGANPADYTTTISYDNGDEVKTVTDPLGHVTSYGYDADGNLTSVTDPNDHTWTYAYDADNRLTTVTAPDQTTTSYGYDKVGNLTSRTDANGHTTLYTYDADNRLIGITDPLNRQWLLGYDVDSNLVSVKTPSSGTIGYSYDALGRRTGISYSDGTPSVSYGYDADGNRSSMSDGAGTVSYSYDQLDRLTGITRGTDSFSYTYDPVGRVASRTYPDGTATSYLYDADGNMTSATTGTATASYQYDPAGNLTQTTLPNTIVETAGYDHAGRLTQLDDGFRTFVYGYDPAGNVTSRAINGADTTYSYDALDRLTNVSGPNGTIAYGYDGVGNRTTMTDTAGQTSYSYDLADQLQSASGPGGTTSYGFDQNGNETSAGAWTYTVNLAGQLTSASNGTTSASYSYDGDGNRLSATSGGTTDYLWDPNFALPQLALERDTGGLIRRYGYGTGRISMTTPQTTAYYSTDAIGSVTELSGTGGALLGQYDTDPFGGNPTSSNVDPSVASNPVGFAGEYQDPVTGLYDLRARNYDPAIGRFLAPDPLGPQNSASPYTYVGDNPLGYDDPSGMKRTPAGPPPHPCVGTFACLGRWFDSPQGHQAIACGLVAGATVAVVVEAPMTLAALRGAAAEGSGWGASLIQNRGGLWIATGGGIIGAARLGGCHLGELTLP